MTSLRAGASTVHYSSRSTTSSVVFHMALKRKVSASGLKSKNHADTTDEGQTKPKRARPSTKSTAADPELAQPHLREKQTRNRAETSTILTPAEVDFPRGGGTQLSAVELTQARQEGKKDAEDLYTARPLTTPRSTKPAASNGKHKRPNKQATGHASQASTPADHVDEAIRIEHLNLRRLTPGIKIAGLIMEIRPLELIVSLPSQLVGCIPITEISSYYTKKLEDSADQEGTEGSDGNESDSDNGSDEFADQSSKLRGLNEIFKVGQWVRCIVWVITSLAQDPVIRMVPKAELSVLSNHYISGSIPPRLWVDCLNASLRSSVPPIELHCPSIHSK